MKINIAIIFLLVINLLIFVSFSASESDTEKENSNQNQQHLTQQKNSSQIRLLSLEEIHNLENNTENSNNQSNQSNQNIAQQNNSAENQNQQQDLQQIQQQTQQQCYIWTNLKLPQDDFKKIQQILAEKNFQHLKFIDKNQSQEITNNRWWIFIPPFSSRQAAENRAKELLKNTITEYFIIKDGEFKNAISLGIFSQEKSAKDFLKGLQLRNVSEAKLLLRENKKILHIADLSGFSDQQELNKFIEILKQLKVNLNFLSKTNFAKC